jgi:hypothetical protein
MNSCGCSKFAAKQRQNQKIFSRYVCADAKSETVSTGVHACLNPDRRDSVLTRQVRDVSFTAARRCRASAPSKISVIGPIGGRNCVAVQGVG